MSLFENTGWMEHCNPGFAQSYLWNSSGESNIRQFIYGIDETKKHIPDLKFLTYSSEEPYFTSSLPAILKSLGVKFAVLKNPNTCWGYMLANGAPTVWERWEKATGGGMNSHNHPMLGSVDSWMYKYLAGIIPHDENAGFGGFTIRPYITKDLVFAEGEYRSVRGMIRMEITIPANSTARVFIPTTDPGSITESKRGIDKADGIRFVDKVAGYAIYEVGSGEYSFSSKWK
jgi:hypothetical protein